MLSSNAYLDIETTGLDPFSSDITVIGIYIEDGKSEKVIQLIGDQIRPSRLLEIFKDVKKLFTYNGSRFDLPFIQAKLGINLEEYCCRHIDLMYICWQNNLYGGFKEIERRLGITRELKGIDGNGAVILWHKYADNGDDRALKTLLRYNEEDLTNLKILKEKLLNIDCADKNLDYTD